MSGKSDIAKVSILMNGYNAEAYLKEAIDSIYAQTFNDWEIIFIDNCSTDATKKILDSYDTKIKYYKTDKNIPIGAARNFGLQYCQGEYLAFLDTDDIWLNEKLTLQIKLMDENKEYQFCYGGVIHIDSDGKEFRRWLPKAKSGNVFSQLLKGYEVNQQAVFVRNNIDIKMNENYKQAPDYNLFLSMSSKYKACVIDEYLVKYRVHLNSLTKQNESLGWQETKQTLDRIFLEDSALITRYSKECNIAYSMVSYEKAIYLINSGKNREASKVLSKYKFSNYKFFIYYMISVLPSIVGNLALTLIKYRKYN